MTFLQVTGIEKTDARGVVLQNISFSQTKGQKIAIAGETGAGKSTLLKIMAGLIQPDAGTVHFEGERVLGPQEKLVAGHEGIAYLSQQYELPAFLRVEQVLRYANSLSASEAQNLYEICQIEHLLSRRTDELSGGERQRIALALLLTSSPSLLLLDEPFSNLDKIHKNTLKTVIQDISQELDITCTLISHDPHDTLSWAEHILVLKDGHLIQTGTPEQIYQLPKDAYVAGLFGEFTTFSEQEVRQLYKGTSPKANTGFIRPENLLLHAPEQTGLAGQVVEVFYFGSFLEVQVQTAETMATVKTQKNSFQKGDQVILRAME
ncbi:ATP-binding cassette domain-containing protein [Nibribacter ruber]|uniref:ATP-binding cassette domain-containing protein n=1 Tax=Nibribacter ruber TaxID=2698458 RepID=A0A6P1NQS4_9BACT|nr:ATP-binding cassette domain-containing protein [Nibribacter ruber]QHL86186.1 ATP-binding cassette domain-containing protein [Nibribacter ruber]